MNDTDCPLSIVGLEGLIDGVPNAVFTFTKSVPDVAVTCVVAESVTL